MSVIIKSNSLYSGTTSAATVDQILTSPQKVIDDFTARVLADGGTIVNPQKVASAVDFLFKNNLISRMGVCASPYYAVKLDGTGGVLKLYSLDGQDLVGLSIGGGALPKIVDNFVNFNEGVTSDSIGGILTTSTKQAWSQTGRFGVAVATKEHANSPSAVIFGMSTHGETSLNTDIFSILTESTSSGRATTRINNAAYGGGTNLLIVGTINNPKNGALIYTYDKYKSRTSLMVHGVVQGQNIALTAPKEVYENEHYLDFGGTSRSTLKVVSGVKMSAMWFMKDVVDTQAVEINKFQEAEYL